MEDDTLVQCDVCKKWWHPSCIGMSNYEPGTIHAKRQWVREKDEEYFRQEDFLCRKCNRHAAAAKTEASIWFDAGVERDRAWKTVERLTPAAC